jgi:hypothetical protein
MFSVASGLFHVLVISRTVTGDGFFLSQSDVVVITEELPPLTAKV